MTGRHRPRLNRLALAVLAALLLGAGPIACGKRGATEAPEGLEDEFTYPRPYPAPYSVAPGAVEAEGEEAAAEEPVLRQGESKLSPFPPSRTRTTTYGPVSLE